jgi:hypothetical protein
MTSSDQIKKVRSRPQGSSQALHFAVLLALCILAPIASLAIFPSPPGISVIWDLANATAYLAVSICMLLFIYKGRARAFPPFSGRFFANLHRDFGYIVALLLVTHVGLMLLAEPLLVYHLKPTAPLHMLSGLIALALMLLLVVCSIPTIRRRLWSNYHLFRHMHAVIAVAALALTCHHIIVSGFYLNSPWKIFFVSVIALGVLLYYVTGNYPLMSSTAHRLKNSGRYSHLISYGCVTVALLICTVLIVMNNVE